MVSYRLVWFAGGVLAGLSVAAALFLWLFGW
jgi:hypothetical protein